MSLKKRHPSGKRKADTVSHGMKRLKCVGDDVVCTGEEPAPARGPDPLVVTKQSVPVTNSLILSNIIGELQKKNVWIGDDHIDHCQGLLLKQFPATKGLQNRMLFGTHDACNVGAPDGEFLQILNMSGTHWLCASTVGCDPGIINLFDSLYTGSTTPPTIEQVSTDDTH